HRTCHAVTTSPEPYATGCTRLDQVVFLQKASTAAGTQPPGLDDIGGQIFDLRRQKVARRNFVLFPNLAFDEEADCVRSDLLPVWSFQFGPNPDPDDISKRFGDRESLPIHSGWHESFGCARLGVGTVIEVTIVFSHVEALSVRESPLS